MNRVSFSLYRSSIHPLNGGHPRKRSLFWVCTLEIVDEWDNPLFSIVEVHEDFNDLEFGLMERDADICHALAVYFPEKSKGFRYTSLFDEYSNQFFSTLASYIETFPSF